MRVLFVPIQAMRVIGRIFAITSGPRNINVFGVNHLLSANADSGFMMRIGDKALSDTNDIFAQATRLRQLARRYGLLAETLYDPNIVAVVQDCVKELEREAAQEEAKFRGSLAGATWSNSCS